MEQPILRIYNRKDGRIEGRFIKGYDNAGKTLYGAVYGQSEEEVKFKYNIILSEGLNFTPREDYKITVYRWIEQELERRRFRIKPSTLCIYERYLKNHIRPAFSETELYKFNEDKLQNFIDEKLDEGAVTKAPKKPF